MNNIAVLHAHPWRSIGRDTICMASMTMKFPVADTKIKTVETLCIVFFGPKNSIESIK